MNQREIDRWAATIRDTPIERPMRHLSADEFDQPDEFWTCDFPGIIAVIVIVGLFIWAISGLPK